MPYAHQRPVGVGNRSDTTHPATHMCEHRNLTLWKPCLLHQKTNNHPEHNEVYYALLYHVSLIGYHVMNIIKNINVQPAQPFLKIYYFLWVY